MAEQNPQYQYSPLESPTSFRVLKLLPENAPERLQCEILAASIDNPPEYEAVSYVWGSLEKLNLVYCGPFNRDHFNTVVTVTQNCIRALANLRLADQPRYLWIDAICINQGPHATDERTHQIRLMKEIYQRASRVVIFPLGYGDWDEQIVLNLLYHVNQGRCRRNETRLTIPTRYQEKYNDFQLIPAHTPWLAGLRGRSEWFNRTWVIQEAVLARVAVVIVEEIEFSFDEFLDVIEMQEQTFQSEELTSRCLKLEFVEFLQAKVHRSLRSSTKSLVQLAYEFRATHATKPEDKLYALMGIAADGQNFHDAVDTAKEADFVFAEFTRRFINSSRNLDVLSITSARTEIPHRDIPRLPTWAVQWDRLKFNYSSVLDPMGSRNQHNACGKLELTGQQKSLETGVLTLRGSIFDSIKLLSHLPIAALQHAFGDYETSRIPDIPSGSVSPYVNIHASIINTLTCGTLKPAIADAENELGHRQDRLQDKMKDLKDICIMRYGKYLLDFHLTETSRGFLGLTPQGSGHLGPAIEGDLVCIFSGGAVPYVVRKVPGEEEKYWFIGEAYIEGIMDGEAMEGLVEKDLQDFCIV